MKADLANLLEYKVPFSIHYNPERKTFEISVVGYLPIDNQNIQNIPVEEVVEDENLQNGIKNIISKLALAEMMNTGQILGLYGNTDEKEQ